MTKNRPRNYWQRPELEADVDRYYAKKIQATDLAKKWGVSTVHAFKILHRFRSHKGGRQMQRTFHATTPGRCAKCGGAIAVGDPITWSRRKTGKELYHQKCVETSTQASMTVRSLVSPQVKMPLSLELLRLARLAGSLELRQKLGEIEALLHREEPELLQFARIAASVQDQTMTAKADELTRETEKLRQVLAEKDRILQEKELELRLYKEEHDKQVLERAGGVHGE